MKFSIQVGNPRISRKNDPDDETLDECVETCFLLNTEMVLMDWNGIFIPLLYKYSISTMLTDILMMLQELIGKKHGELNISWPSNDFNSHWAMSWQNDSLVINAQWSSVIGKTECQLNDMGALEINKSEFIYEWKLLLETIINGLVECGYNDSNVNDLPRLKEIHSQIDEYGLLYKV